MLCNERSGSGSISGCQAVQDDRSSPRDGYDSQKVDDMVQGVSDCWICIYNWKYKRR